MPADNPRIQATIEAATTDHIGSIVAIADAAELSHWSPNDYEAEIARQDSVFLVATDANDKVLGFIVGRIVPPGDPNSFQDAEIYNIGVDRGFRRFGIGSQVMNAFLNECRSRKVNSIWLDVRSRNFAAIEFYSKAGFAASSIRRGFYNHPSDDAIIMKSMI